MFVESIVQVTQIDGRHALVTREIFLQAADRLPVRSREFDSFLAGEVDTNFVDRHLETLLSRADADDDGLDAALITAALADMSGENGITAVDSGDDSEGDRYSPWARADGFRMGG